MRGNVLSLHPVRRSRFATAVRTKDKKMDRKYNDFTALKSLKKELEGKKTADSKADSQPKRRGRDVVHKTREQFEGERAAAERGLRPGSQVTLMDSNDRGILRHIHKEYVEIEIDGLLIEAGFNDFVVNNPGEDERLLKSVGHSAPKKERAARPKSDAASNELTVDLHLEKLPSGYDVPKGFELPFQLEYFKRTLNENLRHRGMRITFIHGVGDSTLCDAIRKELDERYALSCGWLPGPVGVTIVTIR